VEPASVRDPALGVPMQRRSGQSDLEGLLSRLVETGAVHGGVLGVATSRESHVYGFGSVECDGRTRSPRQGDRFLLTSISKTFTALQVLRLVEQGWCTLRTPVADVVPEFAANGKAEVTFEHLLTHTSGLDDTAANTAEGPMSNLVAADHLAVACAAPLRCPPGHEVAYSSPGFWVLAEAIERCTGRRYTEDLRQTLLDPAGMFATGYDASPAPPPGYVTARVGRPELAHLPEQVRRLSYPAGGVISTVGDLLLYGRMLLDARSGMNASGPLSPPTIAALWSPRTEGLSGQRTYEPCAWPTERGLGWALGGPGDLIGRDCLWHSGGSGTAMWVDVASDITVVLLTATWFIGASVFAQVVNTAVSAWQRPSTAHSSPTA
jgi:CubicO group peptidase (beta-lactamase class C family)